MTEDLGRCFEQLLEGVPKWNAELEGLVQSIETWQREYGNTPITGEQVQRLKKSSSTESMRPVEEKMRPISRNRRYGSPDRENTASTSSSRFARNFRAGYYSAHIQRQMEMLVRGISLGQGYVRKGKMSARMNDITRTAKNRGFDRAAGCCSPVEPSLQHNTAVKLGMQHTTTTQALDEVGSALIESQTLCENAAHFLLRDGDCDGELEDVKRHFADVVHICGCERARTAAGPDNWQSVEEEFAPEPKPELEQIAMPYDFSKQSMSLALEVDADEEEDQKDAEDFFFLNMPNLRAARTTTAH